MHIHVIETFYDHNYKKNCPLWK